MKVILIDDEKKAREVLSYHIREFTENTEIVGSFSNINDASAAISSIDYDLIFLDISMPGGNGFDFIERNNLIDKLIVFVTAHEKYAIDAFKVNAFDYLLKPIDINELKRISTKAQEYLKSDHLTKRRLIQFKAGYQNVILNEDDILYISSQGNYSTVYTVNNESFMISKNLKKIAELYFSSANFIRIHQSHIINLNNVVEFNKNCILMTDKKEIPLSKQGHKKIMERQKQG
ncbi:hypothetical protein DNU06_12615 [Putridiphycobacter roseus]|uniref:DNA-binding response regulator n=1 Tax=Putridiphycobacter roseus TaxID=2219161 RepID=A0A2W1MWX6_9FLAO|nr:LytTR family DNA-binding domain-containing protein [Putridiphycobacter roseus]PZE16387.1 hypothetical protein DNU06_12615 [Putridiphycobacter roseus]